MLNLLSAEYIRMFKNKVMYLLCALAAFFGAFFPIVTYCTRKEVDFNATADAGVFAPAFFGGVIAAIFISLFIGTEYSDGTIRNKLVCGHNRISLFFSKVIVNYSAMLLVLLSFCITFFSIGALLIGTYQYSFKDIIFGLAVTCANYLAYTVLFTCISICNKNKAGTAVFSLVLSMVLIFTAIIISNKLREPKMWEASIYIDDNGNMYEEPEQENPYYISGTKRKVYQFTLDFLPSGQGLQASGLQEDPVMKGNFIYYALIFAAGSVLIALPVFKKKNIN